MCEHCPRKGFGQVEPRPGITCRPLLLHPERNQPAGRRWQMQLPFVPVGRPAASATTPAGRALPAAAVPAGTTDKPKQTHKTREVERRAY